MEYMASDILESYGTDLVLIHGEETYDLRAYFRPVQSKSWSYLEGEYSPLGEIPRGQYVYIGPADPKAEVGDEIRINYTFYRVRRSEVIMGFSGPVYCWAMCVEKGGADTWGRS